MQQREQFLMNQTVGRRDVWMFQIHRAALEIRHAPAGFAADQNAGRHIPRLQVHLPITIQAPRGRPA